MNARNPFSSISNLSILRNAQELPSEGRANRTHSLHKNYLGYQGSYLRDSYLREREIRKNQLEISSKVMGIEALRYMPLTQRQQEQKYRNSKAEYYNLKNHQGANSILTQKPLNKPKNKLLTIQTKSSQFQSSIFRNNLTQRAKCSTKDMFGSDYFLQTQGDNVQEQKIVKKAHFNLQKKQPAASRFKVIKESKQLQQLKQQTGQSHIKTIDSRNQRAPQTLFLKSVGKVFYLYHKQEQQ